MMKTVDDFKNFCSAWAYILEKARSEIRDGNGAPASLFVLATVLDELNRRPDIDSEQLAAMHHMTLGQMQAFLEAEDDKLFDGISNFSGNWK